MAVTFSAGLGNNVWPVLIVFSMEFMQLMRRLYECLFVSIFSKGTMSIVHYFYGVFLYSSFGLGLLASVDVEKLDFSKYIFFDGYGYFWLWRKVFRDSQYTFGKYERDRCPKL